MDLPQDVEYPPWQGVKGKYNSSRNRVLLPDFKAHIAFGLVIEPLSVPISSQAYTAPSSIPKHISTFKCI
jgi:hypothetical protein